LANAATGCFEGEPVGVVAAASAGGFAACVSCAAPAFRFLLRNAIMARIGEIGGGRRGREARRCGRDAARSRDRETRATVGYRCTKWADGSSARETDRERGVAVRNADFGFDKGPVSFPPKLDM
jgi:hypothetical protein